jgi:hypothetical protein
MEIQKKHKFFGNLKICLQPDVSVTNRSRRFKCPDVTVTANRAEGLIHLWHHFTLQAMTAVETTALFCYSNELWAAFFSWFATLKYLSIIHSLQVLHGSSNKRMIKINSFDDSVPWNVFLLWISNKVRPLCPSECVFHDMLIERGKEGKWSLLLYCYRKILILNFQNACHTPVHWVASLVK